jgi:urate oxidase
VSSVTRSDGTAAAGRIVLGQNNYGKDEVRIVKVIRGSERHEIRDLWVDVALEGDFEAAHVSGDNTGLLATDTMRNTVYALAKKHLVADIASFGLRTTGAGWEGFLREEYTSLPGTSDRIVATIVTATWDYEGEQLDFDRSWQGVREVVLRSFGDQYSPSVQATLYHMGEEVLKAHGEVSRIHFSLPNKHHLLYDLGRFGIENDHEIFHASSEPHGLIEGTVERAA